NICSVICSAWPVTSQPDTRTNGYDSECPNSGAGRSCRSSPLGRPRCPLWVISGHVGLHERESALPLKADIPFGGEKNPLIAIGGRGRIRGGVSEDQFHIQRSISLRKRAFRTLGNLSCCNGNPVCFLPRFQSPGLTEAPARRCPRTAEAVTHHV